MTFYDDFGNVLETADFRASGGKVHDIGDILDHGQQPDFDKEDLIGENLVVSGITGPEDYPLGAVYFILVKRPKDAADQRPWGVMFPAKSPVVTATLRAARQGKLPFRGVLDRTTSESDPNRQYWNWRRR